MLEWILRRCDGSVDAVETPIGYVPRPGDIDLEGIDTSVEDLALALKVGASEWTEELGLIREHLEQFGDRLPDAMTEQLAALEKRLADS